MLSFFNTQIWLHPKPIDFRKQIDGLVLIIADHLQMNPASGQLFLFRNKQRDKLKMLYWEHNGFWLLYRRLEKGRFKFPDLSKAVIELNRDEFSWLLSGLDFTKHNSFKPLNPTLFL